MPNALNTLHFPKLSKYDRREPVTFAVPFAEGELANERSFRLMSGDTALPCQTSVTGTWPGGSVRWLFFRAQLNLPGNAAKTFHFRTDAIGEAPAPETALKIEQRDDALHVAIGALTCRIPRQGLWPVRDVAIGGKRIWDSDPFRGITMRFGEIVFDTSTRPMRVTIEERGPIRAVVRLDGTASDDANAPLIRARLTFWAGSSQVQFAYTVTSQNPTHNTFDEVRDWHFELQFETDAKRVRAAQGIYLDKIQRGEKVAASFTADELLGMPFEHPADMYVANSWSDWESDRGGVFVSVKHAAQNFPKRYDTDARKMTIGLYPSSTPEPLEWFAGTAKTHEMLLAFHGPDFPDEKCSEASLQFHLPDVPVLPKDRYAHAGVWIEQLFDGPECRRAINAMAKVGQARAMGLGIFNFGDEWEPGYTNQGRGQSGKDEGDRLIWLNNEYDLTHHFYLFYARTGLRRFHDFALNTGQHWIDVDINHSSPEPRLRNGHIAHCRRHAGLVQVGPSHQWLQGLFDRYHFTGDPDALSAAIGVADNVVYLVESCGYLKVGEAQTREMGWALRAMLFAWRETHTPRYREVGQRIVTLFSEWAGQDGAMLAPYTSHTMVRVPFMNALTGTSLAMWHLATGDIAAKRVAVAIADDLIENATLPWGLPYYKELPTVQQPTASTLTIELYSYAYRLTGDRKYLEAALVPLEDELSNLTAGTKVKRKMTNGIYTMHGSAPPGGKVFAQMLVPVLQTIAVANSERLVKSLDYRLEL